MPTSVSGLIQIYKRNVDNLRPTLTSCRNQVLNNLDRYAEPSQITSDSNELKTPSVEDKCLAGASLHPPGGPELTTSPCQTLIRLQFVDFNYPKSLCNRHKPVT
jgi:hypothetical protein